MNALYWITRAAMRHIYFSPLDIRLEGLENVPREGPAVIVGNHPCAIDGHLVCALCPRGFYSFARSELFEDRISRWHFRSMGSIPVTVGGDNRTAMEKAAGYLRKGEMIILLPESDVYPGTELNHFYGSFMKLSLTTGAPILPVAIVGTERALADPRPSTLRGLRTRRCRVSVHFLPIMTFDNPSLDRERFSADVERVRGAIQARVWQIAAETAD